MAGILLNETGILQLIREILMEQNEEGWSQRCYMPQHTMSEITESSLDVTLSLYQRP